MRIVQNTEVRKACGIFIWLAVIFLALFLALSTVVFFRTEVVKGKTMEPLINRKDCLIVFNGAVSGKLPDYGDIILFDSSIASDEGYSRLFQRVVGLPGDTVEVKSGVLYRNGKAVKEGSLKADAGSSDMKKTTIAEDCVLVLGDNPTYGSESINLQTGTVKLKDIIGKAVFRVFPLNRFGRIKQE